MTFDIAKLTVPYFSRDENAAGPQLLSVWRAGPVEHVDNYDAVGPLVQVPNIMGTVSPLIDADLDVTENSGRRREGHIQVTTLTRLQVDDESTGETSWLVLHRGKYFFLEELNDWHYATGFVYRGTLDRRYNGV